MVLLFVKGQIDVFTFLSFMKSSCLIEFPHVGVCQKKVYDEIAIILGTCKLPCVGVI